MLNRVDIRREVRTHCGPLFSLDNSHIVQAVNTFIYELGWKEDDIEKRKKIDALALKDEEWDRVTDFCNLLSVRLFLHSAHMYLTHIPF
jgi:hypothetical protein